MSDLAARIAAAQREAGERVVLEDLRARGLLSVAVPDSPPFKEGAPLEISSEVSVRVKESFVVLTDKDPNGPTFLDVEEARMLRDWLNLVLPDPTGGNAGA